MAEFKFSCPQCGQNIRCDTGYSGMQINCPACQQAIVVPQAPRAAAPVPPPAAASSAIRRGTPALAAGRESSGAPVPPKSRMLKKVLVIAASVLVLAGLIIGGWYDYSKIRIHKSMKKGLVALWSGEGDGKDSVGGNTMELTDISFEKGKVGQAFSFNGTSSSVKIPASQSLDIGADNGFTLMMWIKPSDVRGFHPMLLWTDERGPLNFTIGLRPSENGVLLGNIGAATRNHFVLSNPGCWPPAFSNISPLPMTRPEASAHGI